MNNSIEIIEDSSISKNKKSWLSTIPGIEYQDYTFNNNFFNYKNGYSEYGYSYGELKYSNTFDRNFKFYVQY